jgi:hypothetical protein
MNKDSNPSKPTLSDTTKTTELATNSTVNKNYFIKVMAETSQHSWHIDSGANYIITPDKA